MVEKDSSFQLVSLSKRKSTRIVIKETIVQQADPLQSGKSKIVVQLKRDGKRKAVESAEGLAPTRTHLEPLEWKGFIPESAFNSHLDSEVIVYKGPLFMTQVPYKLDTPSSSSTTTIMLNNF